MRRFVLLTLLSAAIASPAHALDYWRKCPGEKPWHALFRDGVQQGIWKADENTYLPFRVADGSWGAPTSSPPVEIPESLRPKLPTGVIPFRVNAGSVSISGRPATAQEAIERIREASVPDDKGHLWVTVIGTEADRAAVVRDFADHPALAAYRHRVRLQAYAPDSWAVSEGFVTTGHPTIYYQEPDGRTLGREDAYRGPEATAASLDRYLRRRSPNYDPAKDPDPAKPDRILPNFPITWEQTRPFVLGALGGMAALLWRGRKES